MSEIAIKKSIDQNNYLSQVGPELSRIEIKLYFRRWILLFVFGLLAFINAFNWIEYGAIQNVMISFYNISLPVDMGMKYEAVNWLSSVYMIVYVVLAVPIFLLLNNIRIACVLGAFFTMIGSVIKCASVSPNLFPVAILGQTFSAIGFAFTSTPGQVSSLWFGPKENATATSIVILWIQLGISFGILIPTHLIPDNEKTSVRLYILLISIAVLSILIFIASLIGKINPGFY